MWTVLVSVLPFYFPSHPYRHLNYHGVGVVYRETGAASSDSESETTAHTRTHRDIHHIHTSHIDHYIYTPHISTSHLT